MPGKYGIGTSNYGYDYDGAAKRLVELHNEGRDVDTLDYDVRRVMEYNGVRNLDELRTKIRGW